MSAKGQHRETRRVLAQKMNKQENNLYYQNGTDQKNPRTDAQRAEHRKLAGQKFS